jgi:RNA polymerase sigma factor (sigma-70 family)
MFLPHEIGAMTEAVPDVQELLLCVQQGDQTAAAVVFNLYKRRLLALARSQLDTRIRRKVDPEDVVQSVFRSYFQRQQQGSLAVQDWDHLWSLLAMITVRKCTNARVFFTRQKRNAALEVAVEGSGDEALSSWQALAREPTPEQAAVLAELIERLIAVLPERERRIVQLSLEGQDARAVADTVQRSERTVRRTLDDFRQRLEQAVLQPSSVFADAQA